MKIIQNQYITKSNSETKKLAEQLAKKILKSKTSNRTIILALEGDLGSGKTTFLQGFAKGLGVREKILSPTFVILKKFKIQNPASNIQYLIHIDCYRIQNSKELLDLGFKEIISKSQNIIAIEWSNRIRRVIPSTAIKIKFDFINKKTRKISLKD